MPSNRDDYSDSIQKQFLSMPSVVQKVISEGKVSEHMQILAGKHKLHLDQWEKLETEVLLALLDIQPVAELGSNIERHVGVSHEEAVALVASISDVIFRPIREELERELGHPQAKNEEVSDVEKLRQDVLKAEGAIPPPPSQAPTLTPGTPPPPKPDAKVVRGPSSGAYKPGETSSERKEVIDDPYREQPF